jgi:hypothetical protein
MGAAKLRALKLNRCAYKDERCYFDKFMPG